ncbi:MAG: hypothetical protein K2P93_02095 [Alphaproteobacteria bacterium]|nr:hypothetical protein [Alphaproteobacteria bacterium]
MISFKYMMSQKSLSLGKVFEKKQKLIPLIIPTIHIILIIGILGMLVQRGLDITDEGLYLTSLQYPRDVLAVVNLSHIYSHFLYKISFDHIVLLRILGVLLQFIVSAGLITVLLNKVFPDISREEYYSYVFSVVGVSGCFYFFNVFTPHYNWQNSIAFSIFSIFVVLFLFDSSRYLKLFFLFSLGIMLGFIWFIKPTSFVVSLGIMFGYFLYSKKDLQTYLALSVGTCFCFLLHFLFLIDFHTYYQVVSDGLASLRALGSTHLNGQLLFNFLENLAHFTKNSIKILWPFHLLLLLLNSLFCLNKISNVKYKYLEELIFILVLLKLSYQIFYFSWEQLFNNIALIYFSLTLFLLHFFLWHKKNYLLSAHSLELIFFMTLLPLAGVIGTNARIEGGIVFGGFLLYYVISCLLIASIINKRVITRGVIIFVCSLNLWVMIGTIYHPYRLNKNYLYQTEGIEVGFPSTMIKVDSQTKDFIELFRNILVNHGFKEGSDMIGFTRLNGLVFAVGGRSPGAPWYVSGYPGSKAYNTLGISLIPKERLMNAWILIAENDSDSVPDFKNVGITFESQYKKIAEIMWPLGNRKIGIYKPTALKQL